MTRLALLKRLAITWASVSWFAMFVLYVVNDPRPFGAQMLRAIVAGFFVALCTAPAYYWRFKRSTRAPDMHQAAAPPGERLSR